MDDHDDGRTARAPEPDDVVRICRALNDAGAQYLLIGGFAVIAHGAGRFTKDIDLLVDDAELGRRRQALKPPAPLPKRGYARLYAQHVLQADQGCDFDFLQGD